MPFDDHRRRAQPERPPSRDMGWPHHTEETLDAAQTNHALIHRFPTEATDFVSDGDLCSVLRRADSPERSLLDLLNQLQPDVELSPWAHAVVNCLDQCTQHALTTARLEPAIEHELTRIFPFLAADYVESEANITCENPFLSLADLIGESAIGWNDSLGRSGENLLRTIRESVDLLPGGVDEARVGLGKFLGRERNRIEKLETRLVATETGKLRALRARNVAAGIINDAMRGSELPAAVSQFLKGPWFESIQLVILNKGEKSPEHQRIRKLTETLVWSMQPIDDAATDANAQKQRLYRIVEDLPGELRELLLALEHSQDATEAALEAIAAAHLDLISGQTPECEPFGLLDADGGGMGAAVSKALLKRVGALSEGQWFTFTEGDSSTRIKLVLKLSDAGQLLFTNRNGIKALEKRFDEFAYFMSSGAVKPLPAAAVFSATLKSYVEESIQIWAEALRAQEAADEQAERERVAREASEAKARSEAAAFAHAREASEAKRQEEIRQLQLEKARLIAEKTENAALVVELREQVAKLAIGAWLTLPGADGRPTEGKLAVKIASADKLIFVSRGGVKVGEFASEQLVQLLVAGDCSIEDAGVEFEDTLAQVVTGLRNDRNKSYDDLTRS